jgi:mannose-6-phosphate isomerase-like protein (cupin superfamily)
MIHEDERRILEDWPEAKIITSKKPCRLGDHYHKIKTEKFILVEGQADIILDGIATSMGHGIIYTVRPEVRHTFLLHGVLIGLCSHVYDPTDDYKD